MYHHIFNVYTYLIYKKMEIRIVNYNMYFLILINGSFDNY